MRHFTIDIEVELDLTVLDDERTAASLPAALVEDHYIVIVDCKHPGWSKKHGE